MHMSVVGLGAPSRAGVWSRVQMVVTRRSRVRRMSPSAMMSHRWVVERLPEESSKVKTKITVRTLGLAKRRIYKAKYDMFLEILVI